VKGHARFPWSEALKALWLPAAAVGYWILAFPLSLLIRRDPRLTIVVGRDFSVFSDNSKYFFARHSQDKAPGERVVYITVKQSLRREVEAAGGEVVLHPSLESWALLLRCGNLVTDSAGWVEKGIFQFSRGARLIQLWHGAPLKQIELDVHKRRTRGMGFFPRAVLNLQKKLTSRYPVYDEVVATSPEFISSCFESAFRAHHFSDAGYPRNDIVLESPPLGSIAAQLIGLNIDQDAIAEVELARTQSKMVCLYMPTFRSDGIDPFQHEIELARLSRFAVDAGLLFVLKLHPVMQGRYQISQYPGIIEYGATQDIYPVISLCDVLITDYSSIYFDYLLLDRPIVFFNYDLDRYLAKDREMYFNYMDVTPGLHCKDYLGLENALSQIASNGCQDNYGAARKELLNFTHRYQDSGSSQRVLGLIRDRYAKAC
jgi:CDP-glycerol glycerophosphotransferase